MTIYYSEDHEWINVDGDVATMGITKHAAEQLGEVVFVEIKEVGEQVDQGQDVGVVESVKAASDIYAPVTGQIAEVNQAVIDNPAMLNDDSEGAAWLCKITLSNKDELDELMDEAQYSAFIE